MPFAPRKVFCLTLLMSSNFVLADAKVDGFFRENLVTEGYFSNEGKSAGTPASLEATNDASFFISREERRLNPEKAPSNNIRIPQHRVRIRTQTLGYPTLWGRESSTIGNIFSQ